MALLCRVARLSLCEATGNLIGGLVSWCSLSLVLLECIPANLKHFRVRASGLIVFGVVVLAKKS
jgi:hypothetical protein